MTLSIRILIYQALFLAIAVALMSFSMIPPRGLQPDLPQPDILFCLIAAWAMRQPDTVRPVMILFTVLLSEIMFLKPPGLWTALVLLATEFLRSLVDRIRYQAFTFEWIVFSGTFAAIIILYQLALAITFVPVLEPGSAALHVLATIIAYPVVVMISNTVFRVRKAGSAEPGPFEGRG